MKKPQNRMEIPDNREDVFLMNNDQQWGLLCDLYRNVGPYMNDRDGFPSGVFQQQYIKKVHPDAVDPELAKRLPIQTRKEDGSSGIIIRGFMRLSEARRRGIEISG